MKIWHLIVLLINGNMFSDELGESPTSSRNSFGSPGRGKGRQKWLNNGRGPVAHMRPDLSAITYTVSMRNIFIPFNGKKVLWDINSYFPL